MRRARGTVQVFTFKDGILARAAHDLQLHFDRFEITLSDDMRVEATLPLDALAVDGPVAPDLESHNTYDAARRAEVEAAMHGVLASDRYPVVRFAGAARPVAAGFEVEGDLELHGRSRPIAFGVRATDGVYRATFDIEPSRWGIPPYRALFGAIRLMDRVRIRLTLTDA